MDKFELKTKVDKALDKLHHLIDPTSFIFDPRIAEIQNEIFELQRQCDHEYDDAGICKYCHHKKEK